MKNITVVKYQNDDDDIVRFISLLVVSNLGLISIKKRLNKSLFYLHSFLIII